MNSNDPGDKIVPSPQALNAQVDAAGNPIPTISDVLGRTGAAHVPNEQPDNPSPRTSALVGEINAAIGMRPTGGHGNPSGR